MGASWAGGGSAPQGLHHAAPRCLAVINLKDRSLAPPTVVRVWNADWKAGPGGRLQGASPGSWAPKLGVRLREPREGGGCGVAGLVARAGSSEGGAEAGPVQASTAPGTGPGRGRAAWPTPWGLASPRARTAAWTRSYGGVWRPRSTTPSAPTSPALWCPSPRSTPSSTWSSATG